MTVDFIGSNRAYHEAAGSSSNGSLRRKVGRQFRGGSKSANYFFTGPRLGDIEGRESSRSIGQSREFAPVVRWSPSRTALGRAIVVFDPL
jgi:hypothetical protein